ncbi:MAG: hypothetical protein P4L67_02205 [Candidatus Pacebacteria bacterium]|nr:hypothetical protein [Candidatus Paceibacterota bacterium]
MELSQFGQLKYPRVLQYAFYLLDYPREAICELDTNKLDWVKAKTLLTPEFFTKLQAYVPLGPRTAIYPKYSLLNTIEKNLEEVKDEEVTGYSFGLGQLLKWIRDCIKLRKQDILLRRARRQAAKEERENKKKEREDWEKRRAEELQAQIKEAEANWQTELEKQKKDKENKNEFDSGGEETEKPAAEFKPNEKELMADWDDKNPPVEVPPEIVDELDNDCVVESPPPVAASP